LDTEWFTDSTQLESDLQLLCCQVTVRCLYKVVVMLRKSCVPASRLLLSDGKIVANRREPCFLAMFGLIRSHNRYAIPFVPLGPASILCAGILCLGRLVAMATGRHFSPICLVSGLRMSWFYFLVYLVQPYRCFAIKHRRSNDLVSPLVCNPTLIVSAGCGAATACRSVLKRASRYPLGFIWR
jgi:hypothetical protein